MKRVLILASLCVLILSGCNFKNQNCQTSDVISSINTNSSSSQLGTPIPINGFSLEDLKLQICVPSDIKFQDPNIDFDMPEHYSVMSGDPTFDLGAYMKAKLYGNYTYVCALTVENTIAAMELPVIFLQGFNLEDIENKRAVIMVGQRQLSMEELSAYEVYRDEAAVVYNFSSLVMTESFDDYIEIHKASTTYDYSWTKDVYHYFQNHIQEIIKRK
ncbi:hypothetical protein [Acetanaerobacterium elongatum]|uniref:Lipoprotein n=1 Tax=Acetanaerobacterium elongatum TaxID=258515 RepID=A0A1H0CHA1_9FIRM|nr:hypothetical protein [Acetanaerobacterium elongatum]SDN57171.1 hypothetical protein SAMN05192585_12327 [Acetanaerobacterium elongatum]